MFNPLNAVMLQGFKPQGSAAEKSTPQKSNQGLCVPHVRDVETDEGG